VEALRKWDRRFGADSIPTSLGVYWVRALVADAGPAAHKARVYSYEYIASSISAQARLSALAAATAKLEADFGTWQMPWGEINRFQRLTGNVEQVYDDKKPSLPVPFTSSDLGALAAYGMNGPQTTKRNYGDRGNSFVAVVEFGPKVKAKTSLAGGNSGNPASPHFLDQARSYTEGKFKDVNFYKADVEAHLERRYHPGQ
jgi:acyl-homoserine-lactone acylase